MQLLSTVVTGTKGVHLHVCKSKERYVQLCSKQSKDVLMGVESPRDTDELMLSTAWSPECCESTDYIGTKSVIIEMQRVGSLGLY